MNIVFIGSPYSGKGIQAELLGKKLNLPVFSMGFLIRKACITGNPKAVEGFNNYSLKGLHLPIELKFDLLKEKLEKTSNGFILDNFPATKEDLDTLLSYLKEKSKSIDKVFYIKISKEEMLKRMALRGLREREDDRKEIVLKRREIQDQDRIPVLEYYRVQGVLIEINGKKSISQIHEEILNKLLND